MYEQINKQLSQSQQDIYRLQKIEAILVRLKEEHSEIEKKVQSTKSILEKENKDYKKITGKSISTILFSLLGSLEERTEKERQDAVEAELKYNQCICDLEDIDNQIKRLESEKLKYKNTQAEQEKLYNKKFQLLLNENNQTAQEIMELSKRIEQSKRNQREIDEAICVGYEVQNSLNDTKKSLSSAENWGLWDIFGGGLITDIVKYSHIEDAGDAAQRTKLQLRRFRTELADVRISEEIRMDISSFARFSDYFFDGLIADFFIQNKISTALESINAIQIQVQIIMRRLNESKNAEQKIQERLNLQLNRLIIET